MFYIDPLLLLLVVHRMIKTPRKQKETRVLVRKSCSYCWLMTMQLCECDLASSENAGTSKSDAPVQTTTEHVSSRKRESTTEDDLDVPSKKKTASSGIIEINCSHHHHHHHHLICYC